MVEELGHGDNDHWQLITKKLLLLLTFWNEKLWLLWFSFDLYLLLTFTFANKRTKHGQFYYDVPRGLILLHLALEFNLPNHRL